MKSAQYLRTSLLIAAGLLSVQAAQAALYDRGGGLIYDDVLDITWLQDANYAKTSGYDADGLMNWAAATTWAANLSYHDSVRNVDFSDWRLPAVTPINGIAFNYSYSRNGSTDYAYNNSAPGTPFAGSTASEMAYMFYQNLGNIGGYNPLGSVNACNSSTCLINVAPFTHLLSSAYWSITDVPNTNNAWEFNMPVGGQSPFDKNTEFYAWALRDGDVAAVPEPETYALMLAGLGLVGFAARRRVAA